MRRVWKKPAAVLVFALLAAALCAAFFFLFRALFYPMPHRDIAKECLGEDLPLVYAVMKAESGFKESAKSGAGAIGLMQLMPATAEFICAQNGLNFSPEKLTDGAYNVRLGCLYLKYLLARFGQRETALAAYNAGEGTVFEWLKSGKIYWDAGELKGIPYPETCAYVKKVEKFRKFYRFYYR